MTHSESKELLQKCSGVCLKKQKRICKETLFITYMNLIFPVFLQLSIVTHREHYGILQHY